jgi:hypothetical protein
MRSRLSLTLILTRNKQTQVITMVEPHKIQPAFRQLIGNLRTELYPTLRELFAQYRDLMAEAKRLQIPIQEQPEILRSLDNVPKDMPYIDMREFHDRLSELINILAKKIQPKKDEAQRRKDKTISKLNAAKSKLQRIQKWQTVYQYSELAKEFAAIEQDFHSQQASVDVAAEIEQCVSCRIQCEKEGTISKLNVAKSKLKRIQEEQTAYRYSELAKEFAAIEQGFRSLQANVDVAAEIEQCVSCRIQCEKGETQRRKDEVQRRKDETIFRLNVAKLKLQRIQEEQTAYRYSELAKEFAAIEQAFRSQQASVDVAAEIKQCVNCRIQCKEKQQSEAKTGIRKIIIKFVLFSVIFWIVPLLIIGIIFGISSSGYYEATAILNLFSIIGFIGGFIGGFIVIIGDKPVYYNKYKAVIVGAIVGSQLAGLPFVFGPISFIIILFILAAFLYGKKVYDNGFYREIKNLKKLADAEMRIWTFGKDTLEAEFVLLDGVEDVHLKDVGGMQKVIPLSGFSVEDQNYIKILLAKEHQLYQLTRRISQRWK